MKITLGELRELIGESLNEDYTIKDLKKVDANVIEKKWPKLWTYVNAYYKKYVNDVKCAVVGGGIFGSATPFVYIPDGKNTVIKQTGEKFATLNSESLAQALKKM